jgi:uncharacterized protein DUF4082
MKNLRSPFFPFVLLVLLLASGRISRGQPVPIARVTLTRGWATFGEVVPKGVAADGLQIGSLATQTDVKTRWPDGSVRFAVVTAFVAAAGNYAIAPASLTTGSLAPQIPGASVTLTIGGTPYTATLPASPSADAWLNGPLVREWRAVRAPVRSTGAAHPFLRVNFDTRVYHDGRARVDVSVENVLDKTGATTVTYDVGISVAGQIVFTKSGVRHYYLTRWRKKFQVGAAPLAAVTPDLTPFNVTRALPPYLAQVTNDVSTPSGSNYEILKSGALLANMPAHGGRPELAPYPDWTARYLVHRNATQRSFVLANGDLSGSWPVHVREAENSVTSGVGRERFISLDQRRRIWYDSRAQGALLDYIKGSPMPIREYGSLTPGPGQSPLIPDNAHQPSIAYVPYLLTGDRFYAEEMAFWANYSMLRTYPEDGVRGANGILSYNEVRGYGWALRNMVDAAAYYPDASPVRAYLAQKVVANLQWLDNYARAQGPSNPFTILWLNKRPDGPQYISMWEQDYLAHAIDRANKQGFAGGLAHREAIARFQLKLFMSGPDYPRAQAAPYVVAVGTPNGSSFLYFATMTEIWAGTRGQERPFAGYYGPEARMTLMIGVERGWVGARAAYDYLWPFIGTGNPSDLAQRAGWALDFYPGPNAPPPPAPSPAISLWSATATPAALATNDRDSVELGMKFRSDVAGTVSGVRFYKGTTTAGTHTATLWSATGARLRTATFTSETASGWQQVNFATPVAIAANTVYVVSYHTNVGNYAYTAAYFASKGVDNGPLHAPATGTVPAGNGVYNYSTASVFPTSTFNANNYWVDVVFIPQ